MDLKQKNIVVIAVAIVLIAIVSASLYIWFFIPGQMIFPHARGIGAESSQASEEKTGYSVEFSGMGAVHDAQMTYGAFRVVSYEWDFGDGETSNERNPVHVYDKPGTYKVKLTITSEDGQIYAEQRTVIVG